MDSLAGGSGDVAAHIVERQMRLLNALRREPQATLRPESEAGYRFLTVTRDEGSLGDGIVRELSQKLSWKVFDKEIVNFIAENSHVREDLVRQLDWKSQSLIEDTILRFLRMPENKSFGGEEYHASLLRTLAYLAAQGKAIILGRGSNVALREEAHGLHIRITASPSIRIRRLSEEWQTDPDEARRRMGERDRQRRNFVQHHFHQELDNPRNYDLMFNTDRLAIGQIIESILKTIDLSARPAPLR